jgi:hypothetical protein
MGEGYALTKHCPFLTNINRKFDMELEQNSYLALQPKRSGLSTDILSRLIGPPNCPSADLESLGQQIADSM